MPRPLRYIDILTVQVWMLRMSKVGGDMKSMCVYKYCVIPRSRNTYLVAYSDFSIVFFRFASGICVVLWILYMIVLSWIWIRVTSRSRNTYLVAYSDFSIVFFNLLFVFILYYEFLIWLFCLGSGFVDSESAIPASAILATRLPRLQPPRLTFQPASVISRVCSPASHFQNPRPPEYIPHLSFPHFLSPPSNASFTPGILH